MALVFPDYEQASQRNKAVVPEISTQVKVKLEQDPSIFSKVRMNFSPLDKVTQMAVANNYIVLTMAKSILFRIDFTKPDKNEEISLSKQPGNTKLSNMFLDPLGQHILLALSQENSPELVYLSRKSSKLKSTVKNVADMKSRK